MTRWRLLLVLALAPVACSEDEIEPVVIGETPAAYRVTYRVEDGDRSTSERITVRRPFESRLETFDDSDDGSGDPTVTEINAFGRSARETDGAPRLALAVPIGSAPGDTRLDAVLEDALDAGFLTRRDPKHIAGRPCHVYRTGRSLRLVALTPPDDDTYVDVCIDAAGLVLEEVERTDGKDRRRRVAIDVELDPDLDDGLFDVGGRTLPIERGGGAVRQLSTTSRTPGRFLELGDDLPLPRVGRYAVVPPQPDAYSDPTLRGRRIASLADILHRGMDVVVVERLGSLEGAAELAPAPDASSIRLGGLGTGAVELTAVGSVITVALEGGRYLRVSGTLPTDELAAVARGLREVDGGTLVPVGEEW